MKVERKELTKDLLIGDVEVLAGTMLDVSGVHGEYFGIFHHTGWWWVSKENFEKDNGGCQGRARDYIATIEGGLDDLKSKQNFSIILRIM